MIYDVYKFLLENEEAILLDISNMDEYTNESLEDIVSDYIEDVIREHFPSANAEQQMLIMADDNIKGFINSVITSMEVEKYGSKDTLH